MLTSRSPFAQSQPPTDFDTKHHPNSPPSRSSPPTQTWTTVSTLSICFFDQRGEKRPLHPNIYPFLPRFTLEPHTQPYPGQPHILKGTHIVMRAASCKITSVTHRQSPMKTGWWDGPLKLQDLSQSNPQGRKYLASPGHQTGTYVVGARPQNQHDT